MTLPPHDLRPWGYGAALFLAVVLLRKTRRFMYLFALLILPGTLSHEICHYLVGLVLNGQPTGIQLLPQRTGRKVALGSVQFAHARWYNAFFIGLAPLALLPLAIWLIRWRISLPLEVDWKEGAIFYLVVNLVMACMPSGQDLKVAARSPIGWILLAGLLAWVGWCWVHRGKGPFFRLPRFPSLSTTSSGRTPRPGPACRPDPGRSAPSVRGRPSPAP
jgi:hypothetical protein